MQGPKKLSRPKPWLLKAEWRDGFESTISLEQFRKSCPCADCTKDDLNDTKQRFSFPKLDQFTEGMFELKELNPVGNYAVNAVWGDGHNTGIYTWETLRDIFEMHNLSEKEKQKLEEKYLK